MRIRLDTQILLYFLVMVLITIAFLTLNHRSQSRSLSGFDELLNIYGRADTVHSLSANMATLQLEISEYNNHSDAETLAALESLQTTISELLSKLDTNPLTQQEAELILLVEQQLDNLFDVFDTEIIPRLVQISELQNQIRSGWSGLLRGLDQIGKTGPVRENPLELGPIFQAIESTRAQAELYFVSPELGLEDQAYEYQRQIDGLVEEFSPYYGGALSTWREEADTQFVLTNQLIQITRAHLYNSSVLLANRVSLMNRSIGQIESLYQEQAEIALAGYRENIENQEFQFLTLAALAGFLAILLSGIVSRQIARPIHELVDVFHDLSGGKRVTKIPMIHRKDDFGKLARAAEVFRHKNEDTQYLLHQSQSLVKELQELNAELSEQITVRERAEKNLALRQEELEHSNRDLSQFAYAASHDLQEPLRMVSSYLQLLERRYGDQLDNDAKDFIGFAVDGASRMKNLIRSLLDYSRIGTHGGEFKEVNLNQVIKSVKKNLEILIDENQAEIVADDLPIVWGDEAQLQTLIQNIITNSIHYSGENTPRIEISCNDTPRYYEISIADNGIGFDQQFSDKIFTIFQRLHTSKVRSGGTGIGLALSKRIVERHEGQIWAVSTPGEGTTITFALPVKASQK